MTGGPPELPTLTIPSVHGSVVVQLSDADADLSALRWHLAGGTKALEEAAWYAARKVSIDGVRSTEYMHRVVAARAGLLVGGPGRRVEHANGDRLDNRRENLRVRYPERQAGGSLPSVRPRAAFAMALRDQPGAWALLPVTYAGRRAAVTTACGVRNGRSATWRPAGAFQALARGLVVHVRYVGLPGAEVEPPGEVALTRKQEVAEYAARLRAAPGQWVEAPGQYASELAAERFAYKVRSGRTRTWRPAGAYEATAVGVTVLARCIHPAAIR